jgi:hypothetical protein
MHITPNAGFETFPKIGGSIPTIGAQEVECRALAGMKIAEIPWKSRFPSPWLGS